MGLQEIRIQLNEAAKMKRDIIADIQKFRKIKKCNVENVKALRFWDDLYKKSRRMLKTARRTSKLEAN